jgi:hypothetical protein
MANSPEVQAVLDKRAREAAWQQAQREAYQRQQAEKALRGGK